MSHLVNLMLGGLGLKSFRVIRDPRWLLASMVGVGFAWASILSLPCALLSNTVPSKKMGVYMGIFNLFIVIPQLLAASVLGLLLKTFFGNGPINALLPNCQRIKARNRWRKLRLLRSASANGRSRVPGN